MGEDAVSAQSAPPRAERMTARAWGLLLVLFVAISGLGGLAGEGWVLVLARFVTGVAAAFLAPAGLSIITTTFAEGRVRNRAVLVYAGAGAGGFSLGMGTGGG